MSDPTPTDRAIEALKISARFAARGNAEEARAASRLAVTIITRELGLSQADRELVSTLCVKAEGRSLLGVTP